MRVLLVVMLVGIVGCGSETPTAMTEFKKGVEFAEQGDYDTAIACYTKAIRINPNLAVAHFNLGMAYYKGEECGDAGMAFDNFVKLFPDDTLTADALFWAGESYRQGNLDSLAFRRYNQCRWDFPASEVAKDARHRLTLPGMLQQYDAEANKVDQDDIPASKAAKTKAASHGHTATIHGGTWLAAQPDGGHKSSKADGDDDASTSLAAFIKGKRIRFKAPGGSESFWADFSANGTTRHSTRGAGTFKVDGLKVAVFDFEQMELSFPKAKIAAGDTFEARATGAEEDLLFEVLKVERISGRDSTHE